MVRAPSIDKNGIKKGEWSKEEDDKLRAYINRYGTWNWRQLPKYAGLSRCGKSCRLRWKNYLQPNVKRGNFTKDEEDIIINLHNQLGKKWSVFAKNLPGRTDNEIKNYWHTHLKKRTQGPNQIMSSIQEIKEESSCQTSQISTVLILTEDTNQESSISQPNNHQQTSPHFQGLTSPNESCCSVLSQSYSSTPSTQESSADFWSQELNVEDYDLKQGSSYSEFSFGSINNYGRTINDLMTWIGAEDTTITPTFGCLDDMWSQTFDTDYMINAYKYQQPYVDPGHAYPSSPSTEEVCLWSYDLSDQSLS